MTAKKIITANSNLANYRAENARECSSREMKNEISCKCSKSFIQHSEFSLEDSKSIFVPRELSFGKLETIGVTNYRDFLCKIRFHRKFDIFSFKSQEKMWILAKDVCITFAQCCSMEKQPVAWTHWLQLTNCGFVHELLNFQLYFRKMCISVLSLQLKVVIIITTISALQV